MFLLIAVLTSIALVVFVIAPLLAAGSANEAIVPIDVTPLADLKHQRLVVYENMQDLEFEYKAGKISSEDYQSLRESYVAEAAELMLASQEAERPVSAIDAFIEGEVAARRARRKPQPAEEYVCGKCGFENPLPVKFCGNCGARIKNGGK
jgi:hypothetical protein